MINWMYKTVMIIDRLRTPCVIDSQDYTTSPPNNTKSLRKSIITRSRIILLPTKCTRVKEEMMEHTEEVMKLLEGEDGA
jgi:predicted component of type VI protein secretion system